MSRARAVGGSIGVFGGTFDPVHYGHLRTAFELRLRLGLGEVRFVPCAVPPHREMPIADGALRARMLRAAIGEQPGFCVDERELARPGPSYSVDTLASLRDDFPDHALCLLLGMDAFLGLPEWRDWRRLIELAHIVVAERPGARAPIGGSVGQLLSEHGTRDVAALSSRLSGNVFVTEVTQLQISSTELKDSIRAGVPPLFLMPEAVWRIIVDTECYAEKARAVIESQ